MVRIYIQNTATFADIDYELHLIVEIDDNIFCNILIFEGSIEDVENNELSEFIPEVLSECPSLVNLLKDPEFISKFADADYIYEIANIKTKGEESSTKIQNHNIVINDVPCEETGFVNPFLCIL